MDTVSCTAGPLTLTLGLEGGVVVALRKGEQPWLKAGGEAERDGAAASETSARYHGAYPLLPFIGRLADGRFSWDGAAYALPPHPLATPHALHGVGWERRWAVIAHGASALTLTLDHPGDDSWPFAFRAEQHFALHAWGLALTMTLTNQHRAPAPAQLGWHPYFPSAGARLGTAFTQRWESDDRDLPAQPVPLPNARWAVKETVWDHCFEGPAQATLAWPGHALRLAWSSTPRSPFRGAVLYLPEAADFFCCEPVTACPNALTAADPHARGVVTLAPGESLQLSIALREAGLIP
jgi:aldose 1-epimerase